VSGPGDLDRRLEAYIEGSDDRDEAGFDQLARELFADQYEHNAPYRRYCRARRLDPDRVTTWTQIPPVPLSAFKELTLACAPPEHAAAVFMTSGSTDPRRRGRNHHPHLRLYDASLRVNFAHWFLPDRDELRLLVLNPRPEEQPESSLAYFLGRLVDFFGAAGSDFFVGSGGLELDRVCAALRDAESTGIPVGLLGASFAYVHLLDGLEQRGVSFRLPAGSRVLDTGGFKGRSREVSAEALRAWCGERLGVAEPLCVNYYGMTEISTQYFDTTLRDSGLGSPGRPRHKVAPPWTRIRVVDPGTGQPVDVGEQGLIVHYDLANRGSCLAVTAEDVGYLVPATPGSPAPGGFVLLGRAEGSEVRGCSVALDELLAADRGWPS
jgi:hypothetical protein